MARSVLLGDFASGGDAIRLGIVSKDKIPAADVALLIQAFDTAFRGSAREHTGRRGFHLVLAEAHEGSLWLLLLAAAEVADLAQEHPDVVAMFMHDLSAIMSKIANLEVDQIPKHFRDLVGSIAQRIRKNAIDAIRVVTQDELVFTPEFVHIHRRWQDFAREERRGKTATRAIGNDESMRALPIPSARIREIDQLAAAERLFGTLFLVEGEWYARLEGLAGVLVPLTFAGTAGADAKHAQPYRLEGSILTSPAGHPVGFSASKLIALKT